MMGLAENTRLGLHYAGEARDKKAWATLRAAAILTTGWVATTDHMLVEDFNDAAILFELTKGSLTSFQYIVEHSLDASTWFREGQQEPTPTVVEDSSPHSNFDFTTTDPYAIIVPVMAKFLRLRVRGVGTVTGSSCAVHVVGVN